MTFIEPLLFLKAELTGAYSKYLVFGSFSDTYIQGNEWWRLITPIFIHFSLTHLIFNCLWVFVLGQQIELKDGKLVFILLMLISAAVGNYSQYLDQGAHLFGGLSGCVYGLFGYAMVVEFQEQKIRYGLPPSMYIFMLAWLVMGFMGILKLFGFGEIANFAHLGGLASGIFFAMILVMYKKTTLLR
jgi:GlpG protein